MTDVRRVAVGDLSDLSDGEMRMLRAGSTDVLVCRVVGRLYAIEDLCSHAESPLSDGMLAGHIVTCALHFASFDVRDGSHLGPPAFRGVKGFAIVEDAGGATVEFPAAKSAGADPAPGGGSMFRTR